MKIKSIHSFFILGLLCVTPCWSFSFIVNPSGMPKNIQKIWENFPENVKQKIQLPLNAASAYVKQNSKNPNHIKIAIDLTDEQHPLTAEDWHLIQELIIRSKETQGKKITTLRLKGFDFSKSPPTILPLSSLTHFEITYSRLQSIPPTWDSLFPKLKILSFQNNALTSLSNSFFQGSKKLTFVDISHNQINDILENFGNTWDDLQKINLANNQLHHLPQKFGQNWSSIINVSLSQNPLMSLPHDFGEQWSRLRNLFLFNTQIQAWPSGVGSNWAILNHLVIYNSPLAASSAHINFFKKTWPHAAIMTN